MEEKNPKSTRTVNRAITKISSIDHLPIKEIKRNIAVFCFRYLVDLGCVDKRRMVRPTILNMGTRILAVKIIKPIA